MNYKVLYRKYRPTNFNDLVGQEHIKKILINSITNNKIAHAYIFTGPRGTGKTSSAKIFARTINCTDLKDGIACGECENCLGFDASPDVIEMDAASNNGVDNIREMIENVSVAPTNGKYKIYIIDEVHMLSTAAWNAFLKTLEEPPSNVIFILATTEIQKVPITVLSRCQRFDFQRIDRELIYNNLAVICDKEQIHYEEDALKEISYLSDGCMRDALSILDQLSKVADHITMGNLSLNYGTITAEDINTLYTAILKNDLNTLVEKLHKIKETGIDIKILIDKILDYLIEKAVAMKKKNVSNNVFRQLKRLIESLNDVLNKINYNSNGFLLLELELISFINDDENQISNREINQIISREIISDETNVDLNHLLKGNKSSQVYVVCDEFINIRLNNTFVSANKNDKIKIGNLWKQFIEEVKKKNLTEFFAIIKSSMLQVASNEYILFVTPSESIKIVGNAKLYELETKFNNLFQTSYKMIFITKKEWEEFMKNYNKEQKYEIQDESEYINENISSLKLAEDIFGNEKLNIE